MTVIQPSMQDVADALLVSSNPALVRTADEHRLTVLGLLPNTPPERALEVLAGIREHLVRSEIYANATAKMARNWFGDCIHTDGEAACFADTLRERAGVWRGEAETLALTAAMRDRERLEPQCGAGVG